LCPARNYYFFRDMVPYLEAAGMVVHVNEIHPDDDLVLACILPCTPEWIGPLKKCGKPVVLWHWDLYSFVDYTAPRWQAFMELLPQAADIWSCTYGVAQQLREKEGHDSYVVPAWVNHREELPTAGLARQVREPYALYAASSASLGKRIDWAHRACELLRVKLVLLNHQSAARSEYLGLLKYCRLYLMTAFEESNATIPAMEAAALGRPVVLADLPNNKEIFGDTAYYFANWDFDGLLATLSETWTSGEGNSRRQRAQVRINDLYRIDVVARRIIRRLEELALMNHLVKVASQEEEQ
jgi:glycosyltransferase involved in cell wall biosynthesis